MLSVKTEQRIRPRVAVPSTVVELTIDDAIETTRTQIDLDRDEALNNPNATVEYADSIFQAGPRDRDNLNDALTLYSALGSTPPDYIWRDLNNTDHPADLGFLAGLGAAMGAMKNSIWMHCWARKAALDALDLDAPDIRELIADV